MNSRSRTRKASNSLLAALILFGSVAGRTDPLTDSDNPEERRRQVELRGAEANPKAWNELLVALRDPAPAVRLAAADALGRHGAAVVGTLLPALTDSDADVRCGAVRALGQTGAPEALDSLLAASRDPSSLVRREAAEFLAKFPTVASTQVLIAALRDKDAGVQWEAAGSLAELRDPAAAPALIQALVDSERGFRDRLIEALSAIGPPASVALAAGVARHDPTVRAASAEVLSGFGAAAAKPLLGAGVDANRQRRRQVAAALQSIRAAAQDELWRAVDDADWRIRALALRVLNRGSARDRLAPRLDYWRPVLSAWTALKPLPAMNAEQRDLLIDALNGVGGANEARAFLASADLEVREAGQRWLEDH